MLSTLRLKALSAGGDRREREKTTVIDQHEVQRGGMPEAAPRLGYLGLMLGGSDNEELQDPKPEPQLLKLT